MPPLLRCDGELLVGTVAGGWILRDRNLEQELSLSSVGLLKSFQQLVPEATDFESFASKDGLQLLLVLVGICAWIWRTNTSPFGCWGPW